MPLFCEHLSLPFVRAYRTVWASYFCMITLLFFIKWTAMLYMQPNTTLSPSITLRSVSKSGWAQTFLQASYKETRTWSPLTRTSTAWFILAIINLCWSSPHIHACKVCYLSTLNLFSFIFPPSTFITVADCSWIEKFKLLKGRGVKGGRVKILFTQISFSEDAVDEMTSRVKKRGATLPAVKKD